MAVTTLDPIWPWTLAVSALALLGVLLYGVLALLRGRRRRKALDAADKPRVSLGGPLGLVFTLLAALCLTIAAWNPVTLREPETDSLHLTVALDVSESVLREDGAWGALQSEVARFLTTSLAELDPERYAASSAGIVLFRGDVSARAMPLPDLVTSIARLTPDDFAGGAGTDLGAGLARAVRQVADNGGRGAILLVSDGHDTVGAAQAEIAQIAEANVPIVVFPIGSPNPNLALSALYLPDDVFAQQPVTLRGVIINETDATVSAQSVTYRNRGTPPDADLFGVALASDPAPLTLQSGQFGLLRRDDLGFQGVGLQYVDVELLRADGSLAHARRLFTHVNRPLQFLGLAEAFEWVAAIDPDIIELTPLRPAAITPDLDLTEYDGVVINALSADVFPAGFLARLADAIEREGIGLFLMNGDHNGADPADPTVLRSYDISPLEPLLPLTSEPREDDEIRSRQVVMFIDTSGSMCGWQLSKAQEIASYIVREQMGEFDYLDVVGFTAGLAHIIDRMPMTEANKSIALSRINSLSCGGGTNPTAALQLIQQRHMTDCGLVFLSDGEFGAGVAQFRPDCRATVFDIGSPAPPANSPLWELADPFGVGQGFNPADIEIPFFGPPQRDNFFEPGHYTPLTTGFIGDRQDPVAVPMLDLTGTAVTYAKDVMYVSALRPKFIDPVLAYRDAGVGFVGEFTTALPPEWINNDEGRAAFTDWLVRVVGYSERDRYHFKLTDNGADLQLEVSIQNPDGMPPLLTAFDVSVEREGETPVNLQVDDVPDHPATYTMPLPNNRLNRDPDSAQVARLVVRERGLGAVARTQRIPLLLPPLGGSDGGGTQEAAVFGINAPLLFAIAQQSGGVYAPPADYVFFADTLEADVLDQHWPLFAVLAGICYVLAIGIRKLL